jgi:hypothetical protein
MQQTADNAIPPLVIRFSPIARYSPKIAAPQLRPLPEVAPPHPVIGAIWGALGWLAHHLLVRPVGRRARHDRLGSLRAHILRDIGLSRADANASAWGMVPLRDVMRRHPRPGSRRARGETRMPLVARRLSRAA